MTFDGISFEPELLTEEELQGALATAREIEAEPVKEYLQRGPVAGGPKSNIDTDKLMEARVEIGAATQTQKYHDELAEEAKILRYSLLKKWLEAGAPVGFIAAAAGYKSRSQVYKAIDQLPRLVQRRAQRQQLEQEVER
jgi:hypothetical protein